MAVYALTFTLLIVVVVQLAMGGDQVSTAPCRCAFARSLVLAPHQNYDQVFLIRSLGVIICFFVSTALLFASRVLAVFSGHGNGNEVVTVPMEAHAHYSNHTHPSQVKVVRFRKLDIVFRFDLFQYAFGDDGPQRSRLTTTGGNASLIQSAEVANGTKVCYLTNLTNNINAFLF